MSEIIREIKILITDDVALSVKVNAVDHPKAVLVLVHGLAEHLGRYDWVVAWLTHRNYTIYRYDGRGHGHSGGERGFVDDYNLLIDDADKIVDLAKEENPDIPIIMLGHSMGGFVTAAYGVKFQDKLDGQILTGAAVILQPSIEPLRDLDFNAVAHEKVANSLAAQICRDPEVVWAYDNDPLVLKEFCFKLVGEVFVKGAVWLMENFQNYRYPCLIMHGDADEIVTPEASRQMFARIGSENKKIILFEGLYHEILNEPERENVLVTIDEWISGLIRSVTV